MSMLDMKSPAITVNRLDSIEGGARLCQNFFMTFACSKRTWETQRTVVAAMGLSLPRM